MNCRSETCAKLTKRILARGRLTLKQKQALVQEALMAQLGDRTFLEFVRLSLLNIGHSVFLCSNVLVVQTMRGVLGIPEADEALTFGLGLKQVSLGCKTNLQLLATLIGNT